ncbi:MAG: bifunctional 5,10-methylene-tetrahydrofolate dehydrogenase/5,10-methylene-tetrahydrofolate cyclohydrolase [Clostridia bacterium]|nr:bifunctional 5,10-methylene-tetrahydrofolate dehydrogenase/5,10-methylene-tetrahydrofolate cyclohydrolase [Clostridia bacterium]
MAELLKGNAVAAAINDRTAAKVNELRERGISPALCIIRVGERPDDLSYERGAVKRAEAVGVEVKKLVLPEEVTEDELLAVIDRVNGDASIHGVLLFRPLPRHINEQRVCNALLPEKDMDGITDMSCAGVYEQKPLGYPPCTAQAVIELMDHYGIELSGKSVAVIGRSLVIGKPVTMMLIKKNATVTVCHTRTRDVAAVTRNADIIVAAAGKAGMVDAGFVSEGQTVIDVGINWSEEKQRIVGDVESDEVSPIVSALTPVPGGVGGVTTSVLMSHVADAAMKAAEREER